MVMIGVVAFAFYAPSLQFGFFNDDPTGHFRWMEGRSVGSLLTDASGHGYYRPFSFILWQILHSILGRHDPFALHLLNVLVHAANAALVTWLARQWTRHLIYASLAGLLFALYPFSYEAVPYVGSFVHPLVTLFVLLTLTFYLQWRAGNARWAFAAAHGTLTLAVLTQENAVLVPLLLLALGLVETSRPRVVIRTLSFCVEPVAFAAAWLLVPKIAETRSLSFETMRANVLPFVQALVYPIAPLAHRNATTLGILAAFSLLALVVLAWRARTPGLLTFGLLMWALASLPSILILDNAYVLGSPRLYYLASVGVALIWAMPVLITERLLKLQRGYWIWGIGVLVFAVCYLPSAGYVRCQLMYQGMAGDVGRLMAEAARATPPERPVTFVNLPYFFSSRGPGTECRSPFVFAPTGAVVIPPYADARDFVVYNGGPDRPTLALAVRDYRPGWQTYGAPASMDQLRQQIGSSRVWVFDLMGWRLFDLSAAWQPNAPPVQAQYTMNGVQISNVKSQTSKDRVVVSLTWQVITPTQGKVFAHVYDGNGKLVAQDDGLPADGFVPTAWCKPGDVITDTRTVSLTGLPTGTYRVTAGMYHEITVTRFEVRDASGARLPDDEIPIAHIVR